MVHVTMWLCGCFTAGADYNHTQQKLTFNESMTQQNVEVPILLDDLSEEAEQFNANLTLVNNNGISVTVYPAVATVNITDDGNSEQ